VPIPAKILLVDDQQFVRRTLCSLLRQQSHWEVYEAENGKAALDRARAIKPDVVVMDIVMPEMSGIEAGHELRRLAPETKVILMSSYYTPEEAAHLARLFGDGNFIEKSATGKDLVPAIRRVLAHESIPAACGVKSVVVCGRRGFPTGVVILSWLSLPVCGFFGFLLLRKQHQRRASPQGHLFL
jgi:DNA-binding NarL/FixJ family response regulator